MSPAATLSPNLRVWLVLVACGCSGHQGADCVAAQPGEYWVDSAPLLHVRVTSNTAAVVTWRGGADIEQFAIERACGATLGGDTKVSSGGTEPPFALRGPFVLRGEKPLDGTFVPQLAIAEGADGGLGATGLLVSGTEVTSCFTGPAIKWRALESLRVRADPDSAELDKVTWGRARATLGWFGLTNPFGIVPWDSFELSATKPTQTNISAETTLSRDQAPVQVQWAEGPTPTLRTSGRLVDWQQAIGRETRIDFLPQNTNGAMPSRSGTSFTTMDFGSPLDGGIDFSAGPSPGVLTVGVDWPDSGSSAVRVSSLGGVAAHFVGSIAGVRVKLSGPATYEGLPYAVIDLAAPGQMPVSRQLNDAGNVQADIMLPSPATEAYFVFAVPQGVVNHQTSAGCATPENWDVLLTSVELLAP